MSLVNLSLGILTSEVEFVYQLSKYDLGPSERLSVATFSMGLHGIKHSNAQMLLVNLPLGISI